MVTQFLFGEATELGLRRQRGTSPEEHLLSYLGATELVASTSETVLVVLDAQVVTRLDQKLQEALDEIHRLQDELSRRPLVSTINLHDLGTDTLRVKLPISVVLHEMDEESLARWPETRAYGIGSTLSEAISELKQNIATLFFDLKARPMDSLGEIALDTLKILELHLQVV
jgi:hypothetical protein